MAYFNRIIKLAVSQLRGKIQTQATVTVKQVGESLGNKCTISGAEVCIHRAIIYCIVYAWDKKEGGSKQGHCLCAWCKQTFHFSLYSKAWKYILHLWTGLNLNKLAPLTDERIYHS